MFDFISDIFNPIPVEFPKDTSWLLNDDLTPNLKNIRRCREFHTLKDTPQSKKFHHEGNVWKHTILVAMEMHKIIQNELADISMRDKRILMIAALCHDLGKPSTTYYDNSDNEWHCKNHGAVGERITRNLIFHETDHWMREEICWLVRNHMVFHHIHSKSQNDKLAIITRLSQGNSSVKKLLYLNLADSLGSKTKEVSKEDIQYRFNEIMSIAVANNCFSRPYLPFKRKSDYTMYVMIGIPGCGKDHYIKGFLPNIECICRDDIREEVAYGKVDGIKLPIDNTREAIVTNIVESRIKKCSEEKRSFVVNQTNMKKKYREALKESAFKYGSPNIVYIYVEAPTIDICKERRGHGNWDSIIDNMWNGFEFPDRSECDEFIFYKQ